MGEGCRSLELEVHHQFTRKWAVDYIDSVPAALHRPEIQQKLELVREVRQHCLVDLIASYLMFEP